MSSTLRWAVSLAYAVATAAHADVLTRKLDTVGQVISNKGDEQLDPIDVPGWRRVELKQWLAEGDQLRTGPFGAIGILFRDETQLRIHANTNLRIKNIGHRTSGDTRLQLERGGVWMRAKTVPSGLSVETPSATVSVRGTDWSLSTDENGAATLVVLSGQVRFHNEFGEVLVGRGETAFAEKGKPPQKRFIVQPRDRVQWQLSTSWIDFISLTGETSSALRKDWQRPAAGTTHLQRAKQAYDLMEYDEARRLLQQARASGEPVERIALVDALIALYDERADDAAALLRQVVASDRRERFALRMAQYGLQVRQQELAAAASTLDDLAREYGDFAEVGLARAWRLSFQGRLDEALAVATAAKKDFPHDVRYPVILAHLHMLLGETEQMRRDLDAGEALDPLNGFVMHLDVLYHLNMHTDLQLAKSRALRALEVAPNDGQLWNDLGLACQDLGDHARAEEALRHAITLQPRAAESYANLAILLITQERLAEAEPLLRKVMELHPTLATGPEGLGLIALARGKHDEAREWLLKAVLLNPGLSEAQTLLAVAYLRDERFDAAGKTLETAIRYDSNDPLPHLLKSMVAQDNSDAGNAIRYARSAFDAYLKHGEVAVNGIQNSQSGNSGLAAAYNNLGMANWGDTLSQRAYNPYWANSHFAVQAEYESDSARLGSLLQGLLLDPSAVSYTPRYAEFGPRRPRHDVVAGASLSSEGGNVSNSESLTAMGFMRDVGSLQSLSYFVSASRTKDSGLRANADSRSEGLNAALGANVDQDTGLLLRIGATRSKEGMPGTLSVPDTDDRSDTTRLNGHLGLHKRLGFHDELLVLAYAQRDQNLFRNAGAFGTGLSPLDLSLVSEFGLEQTHAFYRQGLYDLSFDPTLPLYFVSSGPTVLTPLMDVLPASLDPNPVVRQKTNANLKQLQVKRLFDAGPVQVAAGAEWAWLKRRTALTRNGARVQANGFLAFTDPATVPPSHVNAVIPGESPATVMFPFATPMLESTTNTISAGNGQAYVDLRWPFSGRVLLQSGMKLQHRDDGTRSDNRLHPHAGLAWTIADRHWLRAAYQRQSSLQVTGSLAPLATVGLSVPDAYVSGMSKAAQLQWDSEWNERTFTFVRFDHQQVEGFAMPSPNAFDNLVAGSGTIRRASAGANLWLGERWGLSAVLRHTEARNKDAANDGRTLPLLPAKTFALGATWIHPSQVRFNFAQVYTGPAQADIANSVRLPGYWLSNAGINWQPAPKNWSLSFSVNNLFDGRYRVARDVPGNGRTLLLAVEYRS